MAASHPARGIRLVRECCLGHHAAMKKMVFTAFAMVLQVICSHATTIMVVPVFEPLSLHGTDGDEAISDTGEALQACVMSRPMALTGAFPEVLVESIRSPHRVPTNNPNYEVQETNLLVLANIGIEAEMTTEALVVTMDVSKMAVPPEVDLTARQILKLAIVALRKTLEVHQEPQDHPLDVRFTVTGTDENKSGLLELNVGFTVGGGAAGG